MYKNRIIQLQKLNSIHLNSFEINSEGSFKTNIIFF